MELQWDKDVALVLCVSDVGYAPVGMREGPVGLQKLLCRTQLCSETIVATLPHHPHPSVLVEMNNFVFVDCPWGAVSMCS